MADKDDRPVRSEAYRAVARFWLLGNADWFPFLEPALRHAGEPNLSRLAGFVRQVMAKEEPGQIRPLSVLANRLVTEKVLPSAEVEILTRELKLIATDMFELGGYAAFDAFQRGIEEMHYASVTSFDEDYTLIYRDWIRTPNSGAIEAVLNLGCESPIERKLADELVLRRGFIVKTPFVEGYKLFEKGEQAKVLETQVQRTLANGRSVRFDMVASIGDGGHAIAVECDGHEFHERTKEQAARDRSRDRDAQSSGYIVLRFTGSEIHRNVQRCAMEVEEHLLRLWRRQEWERGLGSGDATGEPLD